MIQIVHKLKRNIFKKCLITDEVVYTMPRLKLQQYIINGLPKYFIGIKIPKYSQIDIILYTDRSKQN